MIRVRIDTAGTPANPEPVRVWDGWWEAVPAVGHTIQLRNGDWSERLRVDGIEWVVEIEHVDPAALRLIDRRVNVCVVTTSTCPA